MAILFYEKKKREIYLGILAVVLILLLIFLWFKFLREDTEELSISELTFLEKREKKIQIDFVKLENQILEDLEPFSPIFSHQEELGRENPFAVYVGTSTLSTSTLPEE
jgi:hypothetical protein